MHVPQAEASRNRLIAELGVPGAAAAAAALVVGGGEALRKQSATKSATAAVAGSVVRVPPTAVGPVGSGSRRGSSGNNVVVTTTATSVVHVDGQHRHVGGGSRTEAHAVPVAGAHHHGSSGATSSYRGHASAAAVRSNPTATDSRNGQHKHAHTNDSKAMTYASYKALRDITRAFLLEPT
jgi:hypothetical protein